MIAYIIRLSRLIFSDNFQIRGINILLAFWSLAFLYKSALHLSNRKKSAYFATLIAAFSPLFLTGSVITTPDTPLVFFISAYVYFSLMAIDSQDGYKESIMAGTMLGLALLSKYTAFSIYLSLITLYFIIKDRKLRLLLIIIPILISTIVYFPNLLYNIRTDFKSYFFQINHAISNPGFKPHMTLIPFLLSQIFIFSPFLFVFYLYRFPSGDSKLSISVKFLKVISIFPFAILTFLSAFKNIEPNWTSFAFIPLTILAQMGFFESKTRTIVASAYQFIIFLIIVLQVNFSLLPLKPAIDPMTQIKDWKKTVSLIKDNLPENKTVVTFKYQLSAELYYYSNREIRSICLDRRFINQEIGLLEAKNWVMVDFFPAKSATDIILNICPENSARIPLVISENLNIMRRVDILYCR